MVSDGPSILQSIGNVLQRSHASRPFSNKSRGAFEQHSSSKVFEETLATRISSLCSIKESQIISLEWLNKALQVLIATIMDAHTLIPEIQVPLSEKEEQWMTNYLEDSSDVLQLCNIIQENIACLDSILMLAKLTVYLLDLQAKPDTKAVDRARIALFECATSLQNWARNLQGTMKANIKAEHFLIKDIPKAFFSAKSDNYRKNALMTVSYATKLTTAVISIITVTALTGDRGFFAELLVPECFAWSKPVQVLYTTVKSMAFNRTEKAPNFFVLDLRNFVVCLENLKQLLEGYENNNNELTQEISTSVTDLKIRTEALDSSLKLLQEEVDKLFYLTIGNRKALLDKLRGHSMS